MAENHRLSMVGQATLVVVRSTGQGRVKMEIHPPTLRDLPTQSQP